MVKILAALVAALSILNSSCACPGATEKVAALVAGATCSGASHSSVREYNSISAWRIFAYINGDLKVI